MATTIDQQVALDETLVPSTQRLRIRRSNFRLPSYIQSKESTLQVVYDVLRNSPFFRAFLVTADVPEIYMQEFWATAKLHHNSIPFKMDTKKSVLDLEAFRKMLHISPRIPSQSFAELPSEEEILEFLSFRLSQAQILWGFYHNSNVDYAYLIWEDFVYQVEHKNLKRSNEMYYPRFTQVIIDYFMTRKPSIPRRNRINWHYVRDDVLFSTIKVVSRHQTTQQYGAILPIELTTDDIRNRDKTDESDDESDDDNDDDNDETVKAGSESDKDDDDNDDEEEIPKNDNEDKESGSEDEGSDEEDQELRLSKEARIQEEEEVDELYRNVNINQGRGLQLTQNIEDSHVTLTPVHPDGPREISSVSSFVTSMLNPISDAGVESIFTTASSPIASLQTPTPIMTPSTIATITFRFDERLRSLKTTFSEYRQTNLFVDAMPAIPGSELGSELTSIAGSELGSELTSLAGSELSLASY
nr:hypothetical protein [Tanacetum cinerariifolium]